MTHSIKPIPKAVQLDIANLPFRRSYGSLDSIRSSSSLQGYRFPHHNRDSHLSFLNLLSFDDSNIATRLSQYEALNNGKGLYIAKQLVLSKLDGQNMVLQKYDLEPHEDRARIMVDNATSDSLEVLRKRLISIEGKFSDLYFKQIFQLFPEKLRPESRKKFLAYDGINNLFN